jgi:hypothetical protein
MHSMRLSSMKAAHVAVFWGRIQEIRASGHPLANATMPDPSQKRSLFVTTRPDAQTSVPPNPALTPQPLISSSIEHSLITNPVTGARPSSPPIPADPLALESTADLVYLSELQPSPVEWLWKDRLASATLAMISGEPGSGKTWLALAIAAALTRGRAPFTGEKLKPCNTLYASMEHDSSEVIHPRFAGLNGDPERFVILRGPISGPSVLPSLLEDAVQRTHARLLILDPFHSLFGHGLDLHQQAETRPLLEALAGLAEKYRCCILLIRHLPKRGPGRPAHRSQGSADISEMLRTEFVAGTSPDAPSQPTLLQVKSTLGPLAPPLTYKIDDAGKFSWTGPSTLTPEELLAIRPTGAGRPERRFAGEWLRQYLQDGCFEKQVQIERDANRDGIAIATLRRAKFDLGVSSERDGPSGSWYWVLPPQENPVPAVKEPAI